MLVFQLLIYFSNHQIKDYSKQKIDQSSFLIIIKLISNNISSNFKYVAWVWNQNKSFYEII